MGAVERESNQGIGETSVARLTTVVVAIFLGAFAAVDARVALAQSEGKAEKQESSKDDAKGGDGDTSREDKVQERSRSLADRIKSVQRKAFIKRNRHEISATLGLSLNDAFYQHFLAGGSYAYHVLDAFALEAHFKGFFASPRTDAVRVVRATQVATPTPDLTAPILTSHLEAQFSPIYGKMSLMSEAIMTYDLYFSAGMGMAYTDTGAHLLGTFAIGSRIFATDWLTVRAEIRDMLYSDTRSPLTLRESAIQNLIMFNLGASFFIPFSFDYRYE